MKTYKVNFLVQNREVAADGWHTMHYYLKRLLYRHLYLYLTHSNLYFSEAMAHHKSVPELRNLQE